MLNLYWLNTLRKTLPLMIVNTLFSTLKQSLEFAQKTEFRINYSLNLFHFLLYNRTENILF